MVGGEHEGYWRQEKALLTTEAHAHTHTHHTDRERDRERGGETDRHRVKPSPDEASPTSLSFMNLLRFLPVAPYSRAGSTSRLTLR